MCKQLLYLILYITRWSYWKIVVNSIITALESTVESIDSTSNTKKEKTCVQETFITKVSANNEESDLDDVFYEDTDEKVKLQKTLDELFQR